MSDDLLFLDIKLQWSRNGKLSFIAYSKPGQKIVYIEKVAHAGDFASERFRVEFLRELED